MKSELIEALLGLKIGIATFAHEMEVGYAVSIEQVDRDVAEDGVTETALAHLSDGHAVMACWQPREVEHSGARSSVET